MNPKTKTSAGLMMYRIKNNEAEIFLVHSGGLSSKTKIKDFGPYRRELGFVNQFFTNNIYHSSPPTANASLKAVSSANTPTNFDNLSALVFISSSVTDLTSLIATSR